MTDSFALQRFRDAQAAGGTYTAAVRELRSGRKQTHWMWFVFPQVAGLGRSAMAHTFALSGVAEAQAYLADPVLGARLRECAQLLLDLDGSDAAAVLGRTDAQKLHSSMTLVAAAAPGEPVFGHVLDRYFDGARDEGTIRRL